MKKAHLWTLGMGLMAVAALYFAQASQVRAAAGASAAHLMVTPDRLQWQQMSADLMEGTPAFQLAQPPQVAIVSGDPSQAGAPFTLRIKLADGVKVPPHWHPTDENITVLEGTFALGEGDQYDGNALRDLPAGSYALMPKTVHHFALSKGETVVQVHGIGPFKSVWVAPPANASAIK